MSKNNRIATRVISMILGILMGVALVILGSVVKAETLVWLALIVWGVIVIIGNIPSLIYSIANIKAKGAIFDLIASIVGILLGLGLIFSQNQVITVILATYMIVFPLIRVALSQFAVEQFKRESLRIILGIVLLLFGSTLMGIGYTVLNLILSIIGWIVIALVTIFGFIDIIHIATNTNKNEIIIDETMRDRLASQTLTFGILSLIFSTSGFLSLLGFIFSVVAKDKAGTYENAFGQIEGKVRVGKKLANVSYIIGLCMLVFVILVVVIAIAL